EPFVNLVLEPPDRIWPEFDGSGKPSGPNIAPTLRSTLARAPLHFRLPQDLALAPRRDGVVNVRHLLSPRIFTRSSAPRVCFLFQKVTGKKGKASLPSISNFLLFQALIASKNFCSEFCPTLFCPPSLGGDRSAA